MFKDLVNDLWIDSIFKMSPTELGDQTGEQYSTKGIM